MKKPKLLSFLFILSVASLSLGQLALFSSDRGVPIYFFDLVVAVYALFGLIYFLVTKKFEIPVPLSVFLLFTAIAAFSLLFRLTTLSSEEFTGSAFYLVRWFFYLIAAGVTYNAVKQNHFTLNFVFNVFSFSALFIAIAGFVQLLVLPDFTTLDPNLGWDPHKNRLASTFFDPNFTGGYLALIIGMNLVRSFAQNAKIGLLKAFFFIIIPLIALFLTFSRSSWGMLSVIVLVLGALKPKARWLLVVAALFAFLTYFAVPRVQTRLAGTTDPADSAAFRLTSWGNAWEIAKDNLLLGVGFNSFRFAQRDYGFFEAGTLGGNAGAGSDSSFLLILATTGIFGVIVFVLSFFWKIPKLTLVPLIFGLFLHSQFVNSVFYPQILFAWLTLWVLL